MGCEVAASSTPIAGPDCRRKPVRDAICLPFHSSQCFAPELSIASFIFLVLFQEDEILEDAAHLSQRSHTLALFLGGSLMAAPVLFQPRVLPSQKDKIPKIISWKKMEEKDLDFSSALRCLLSSLPAV